MKLDVIKHLSITFFVHATNFDKSYVLEYLSKPLLDSYLRGRNTC
jgi:hypothetical protein